MPTFWWTLGIAGFAWGFPSAVLDLATRALEAAGRADGVPDLVTGLESFRSLVVRDGPLLLLGADEGFRLETTGFSIGST